MDIAKTLEFLVQDYKLNYRYQVFHNCYGGGWTVYTHSYYNDSGCFTVHSMPQRGELDFYFAKKFSCERKAIYEKIIDIAFIEPDIWNARGKIWIFNNPFFSNHVS